jgi:Zn-dependent M16 (insulinase) family peptidase
MNLMNHRLSFETYLNPRPYLKEAAAKLAQPEYLKSILSKFFFSNGQMIVVRQLLAETESSEEIIESQIEMEDKVIKEQQEQLLSRQNEKQDTSVLPILKLEDIIKPKRL